MIDYLIGWIVKKIDGMIDDVRDRGLRRYLRDVWEWKWAILLSVVYDVWRGAGLMWMYLIAGGASDWIRIERDYWSWKGWKWWG